MLVLARAEEGTGTSPTLAVPSAAIQQVEGKDVVFVKVQPRTYRMRPVALGERGAGYVEVRSGLAEGEPVVTEGSFVLKSEALKATLGGDG
jgi:cobalt-zinc-cadmium efflux system membrane fusion protein